MTTSPTLGSGHATYERLGTQCTQSRGSSIPVWFVSLSVIVWAVWYAARMWKVPAH